MTNNKTEERIIQYQEGSPWFWKIFGGAIMGLLSLLLLGHITSINSNVDRTFLELRSDIKEIRSTLDTHKERLMAIDQSSHKNRIEALEKNLAALQMSVDEQKQKMAANDASIVALKEEVKTLRDWYKDMSRTINELREKLASEITARKERESQKIDK